MMSGKVKLGRRCADGRSFLLAVVGPSDVFGDLAVFDPGPRTASATALTKVSAMAMDRDVLRGWVVDHPEIAQRLLRVLARRLRRTDHDLSDLIITDVPGRAAKHLLPGSAVRRPARRRHARRPRPNPSKKSRNWLAGRARRSTRSSTTSPIAAGFAWMAIAY